MNTLFKYISIIFLASLCFGCVDDFDEMNVNPNNITEVEPGLLLPKMQYEAINANANEFQRGENLFANLYCQWISNSISYFNSDRYEFNNDWATVAFWLPYYTFILKDLIDIKQIAEKKLSVPLRIVVLLHRFRKATKNSECCVESETCSCE